MIDQGNCSNAKKSHNAESYGFRASFIGAPKDDIVKYYVGVEAPEDPKEIEDMVLVQNRTIPEFMLLESVTKYFANYMNGKNAKPIYIKIDLSVPHPDNSVEVALWYSSLLDVPESLFHGMFTYQKIFKDKVSFTPRIVTFDCHECPQKIKERDCLSNGKYCPFLPQHDGFNHEMDILKPDESTKFTEFKIEGRYILLEALRQKCTWEATEKFDPTYHMWF